MYIVEQFSKNSGFIIVCVVVAMVLGAVFGSFACCQAWRIRLKGEGKNLGKRSVCLKCGRKLKWYENIPIVSWLVQKGRCRGCGKKIGKTEIIAEILGMLSFIGVGIFFAERFLRLTNGCKNESGIFCDSTTGLVFFILLMMTVLAIFVVMMIIAIYDARWGEMPAALLYSLVGVSILYVILTVFRMGLFEIMSSEPNQSVDNLLKIQDYLLSVVVSVLILAGTYFVLYIVSREKWVGGGDWILCLAIALVLGQPFLALLELTISNILGLIVMLPKRKRKKLIPFGPFLAIAFAIIFCFFVNI